MKRRIRQLQTYEEAMKYCESINRVEKDLKNSKIQDQAELEVVLDKIQPFKRRETIGQQRHRSTVKNTLIQKKKSWTSDMKKGLSINSNGTNLNTVELTRMDTSFMNKYNDSFCGGMLQKVEEGRNSNDFAIVMKVRQEPEDLLISKAND